MKFLVKALQDAPPAYGDRRFTRDDGAPLAKGDETELSSAGFELVMNEAGDYRRKFGDVFELVREIPETPEEEARAKPRLLKQELMAENKSELVEEAKDLGLPTNLNKEPLADQIVDAKIMADEQAADAETAPPLTAASGQENPKAKRGGKR